MPERPRYARRGKRGRAVSDVLESVMTRYRLARGAKRARPVVAWAEVVGDQLARTTRAVVVRDGVMIVETQDAIAANFLTMQREMLLEKLRAALGDEAPKDLRFQMGVFQHAPRAAKPKPPPPLPRAERERVEGLVARAPEGFRAAALAAAEALARARLERERRGLKPCALCDAPSERSPCANCRNLMASADARALQTRLLRDPDAALEPEATEADEVTLNCARFLALEYLEAQFEALLPQVVRPARRGRPRREDEDRAPDQRLILASLASKYLALRLEKPIEDVTRRDREALPERVRHVLNATDERSG